MILTPTLQVQIGFGLAAAELINIPPKAAGSAILGILIHSVKLEIVALTLDASADCGLAFALRRTVPARWGELPLRRLIPSNAVALPALYGITETDLIWTRKYTWYSNASQQAINERIEETSWKVGEVLAADTIALYASPANLSAYTGILQIEYDLVELDEFSFERKLISG